MSDPAVPLITGVPTSITAFVGRTPVGPTEPQRCASFAEFQRLFGGFSASCPLTSVVADFFGNGGGDAIIVRVTPSGGDDGPLTAADLIGRADQGTGIHALDQVDLFNLLCIPPDRDDFPDAALVSVYQQAAAYCVKRRAMLIADPLRQWSVAAHTGDFAQIKLTDFGISYTEAANCAVYFPRILKVDTATPDAAVEVFAASGAIAGVFAATDRQDGVWKAAAGVTATIAGIAGLEFNLTDAQNGMLNPQGINCLRSLPAYGPVIWGARTMRGGSGGGDYQYITVSRLALYLEESIYRGTRFAVFEPNGPALWAKVRDSVSSFMLELRGKGAFYGYWVTCDRTTVTPEDIANGVLNIVVGFAPVQPAEFVILQIQQQAVQATA